MPRKLRNYKLFPRARTDLKGIWRYTFETWSADQANTYHQRIVDAFAGVVAGARQGRNVDHIRAGYFCLSVGSHFIFYRESGEVVEIVRILHQRQDFERHL